jgi:hypothetical protein
MQTQVEMKNGHNRRIELFWLRTGQEEDMSLSPQRFDL